MQYLDAYSANQRFYRNKEDNKVLGVYTLTLVVIDGDENDYNSYYVLGTLDYSDFIAIK